MVLFKLAPQLKQIIPTAYWIMDRTIQNLRIWYSSVFTALNIFKQKLLKLMYPSLLSSHISSKRRKASIIMDWRLPGPEDTEIWLFTAMGRTRGSFLPSSSTSQQGWEHSKGSMPRYMLLQDWFFLRRQVTKSSVQSTLAKKVAVEMQVFNTRRDVEKGGKAGEGMYTP